VQAGVQAQVQARDQEQGHGRWTIMSSFSGTLTPSRSCPEAPLGLHAVRLFLLLTCLGGLDNVVHTYFVPSVSLLDNTSNCTTGEAQIPDPRESRREEVFGSRARCRRTTGNVNAGTHRGDSRHSFLVQIS